MPSRALGSSYGRHFNALGGAIPPEYIAVTQASTDQGNVSHALPSLHTDFWIESEGGGPHTADFEKAARREDAYVIPSLLIANVEMMKLTLIIAAMSVQ